MGIAIGAAVPVLLSALGANLNGKRTAFIYLLIDVLGVLIWAAAVLRRQRHYPLHLFGRVSCPPCPSH